MAEPGAGNLPKSDRYAEILLSEYADTISSQEFLDSEEMRAIERRLRALGTQGRVAEVMEPVAALIEERIRSVWSKKKLPSDEDRIKAAIAEVRIDAFLQVGELVQEPLFEEPGAERQQQSLRLLDELIAHTLSRTAISLTTLPDELRVSRNFRLYNLCGTLARFILDEIERTRDFTNYQLAVAAAETFVGAVKRTNSFQFYRPAYGLLARTVNLLAQFSETSDLANSVSEFSALTLRMSLTGARQTPAAATALPTVRNMLLHLEVEEAVDPDSYESVSEALDLIETRCSACVQVVACSEPRSGCDVDNGSELALSCVWLLRTYLVCLENLWWMTRTPEPLDLAVALAQARLPPEPGEISLDELNLRCVRYKAYQREDDRSYLSSIFESEDYSLLRERHIEWLSTPLHDQSDTIESLGLQVESCISKLLKASRDLTDAPPVVRLELVTRIAQMASDRGLPMLTESALDLHHELYDDLYRLSGLSARTSQVIRANRNVPQLHAAVLAASGKIGASIERLELDRVNDLRDDLTFWGFRFRDIQKDPNLASDYLELQKLQRQYESILPSALGDIAQAASTAERVALRRRIDALKDRIASMTGLPSYRNPVKVEAVQQRASSAGVTVIYLWSTSDALHLACIASDGKLSYRIGSTKLDLANVASMVGRYRAARAEFRASSTRAARYTFTGEIRKLVDSCFLGGLSELLEQLVEPTGECVLVRVGDWNFVPLHLGAHLSNGRYFAPIVSYAPFGVATAPKPDYGQLPALPSLVLADLIPSSSLPWAVIEGEIVARILNTATATTSESASAFSRLNSFLQTTKSPGVVHIAAHASLEEPDRPNAAAAIGFGSDGNLDTVFLQNSLTTVDGSPRLLFFSACESGGIGGDSADELMSLQGAAIVGGVADVLVTEWPVNDLAATLFAYKFYSALLAGRDSPRRAAFYATEFVRTATGNEALGLFAALEVDVPPTIDPGTSRLFPSPSAWGAFCHYQGW